MADTLYSQALTTQTRVKNRLKITTSSLDTVLIRLINAYTDFIEGECNRKFLRQIFTNEVYSVPEFGMRYLQLKQGEVTSITSLSYRAGTPSTPNYTAFTTDQFELLEDGKSGIVRIYDTLPYGVNAIRATYVAGYLFDFTNFGTSTHTLPADLTEVCEQLVIRALRRSEAYGKTTEGFDGASVTWSTDLDADQQRILDGYHRGPAFV